MRTILLALVLVGVAALAPAAAAHITLSMDRNGDRDCNDPGETISIPTELGGREPHDHGPCAI